MGLFMQKAAQRLQRGTILAPSGTPIIHPEKKA
jgi:hypothetical protein